MKIYKYENYEAYVEAQTKANIQKQKNVWVSEDTMQKIYDRQPFASNILCHGSRNAAEQKFFKKFYQSAQIIGTEISHTASQYEMTVQHDFHEVMNAWINKFDIIYSNSFDHSYDPVKCLNTWKDQLSSDGSLYLEHCWQPQHNISRWSDPLEISKEELLNLFMNVGLKVIDNFPTIKNNQIYRVKK